MAETADEKRAHSAALVAIEAVEADTLRRLASAVTSASKGGDEKAARERRQRIEAAVALVLIGGRRDAREASADAIAAEVNAASSAVELRWLAAWESPGWALDSVDAAQARRTAGAYADLWAGHLETNLADGRSFAAAARRAANDTRYRLATDAITEIAQAAELEADRQIASLPHHLAARLLRRWDATRDRRACAVCRSLDGVTVLATLPFPRGLRPGYVHPRCRCRTSIRRA